MLVLGGVRSGKSAYAERLLRERADVRYIAAGPAPGPDDREWQARVEAHRARRPASWTTVEATPVGASEPEVPGGGLDGPGDADATSGRVLRGLDLPAVLGELDGSDGLDRSGGLGASDGLSGGAAALVDCLGTWVTRLVDENQAWDDRPRAEAVVAQETERLVAALRRRRGAGAGDVVLVSNEVGLGVVPASASGRLFRDLLGRLNAAVAAECDHTVLVVAGRVLDLSATPTIETAPTFGLSGPTPGVRTGSEGSDAGPALPGSGGTASDGALESIEGIDIWADAGLTWTDES